MLCRMMFTCHRQKRARNKQYLASLLAAPGDFQAQDRASITFEANETEKVVTVEIVEDTEPEQQLETFTAILSLPPSITGVEIGSPAEVTIVDNDGRFYRLLQHGSCCDDYIPSLSNL